MKIPILAKMCILGFGIPALLIIISGGLPIGIIFSTWGFEIGCIALGYKWQTMEEA